MINDHTEAIFILYMHCARIYGLYKNDIFLFVVMFNYEYSCSEFLDLSISQASMDGKVRKSQMFKLESRDSRW